MTNDEWKAITDDPRWQEDRKVAFAHFRSFVEAVDRSVKGTTLEAIHVDSRTTGQAYLDQCLIYLRLLGRPAPRLYVTVGTTSTEGGQPFISSNLVAETRLDMMRMNVEMLKWGIRSVRVQNALTSPKGPRRSIIMAWLVVTSTIMRARKEVWLWRKRFLKHSDSKG